MATSVRDAMTEEPHSIDASASIVEAARLMRDENIGSLPITDDGKLAGMITDRDITTTVVADGADPKATSVGDIAAIRSWIRCIGSRWKNWSRSFRSRD